MWSPHHTLLIFFQTVFPLRLSYLSHSSGSLVFPLLSTRLSEFCLFYYILQNPNLWVFSPSHALHPTPWDVSFPSPARSPANLPQGPHGLQALIATFITQGINTTKHLLSLHRVIEATKYFQGCGCPQASEPQRLTA